MNFVLYVLIPMFIVQIGYAVMQAPSLERRLTVWSPYFWLALYWVAAVTFRNFYMTPDDINYVVHLNRTTVMEGFEVHNLLGHSPLYYWILGAVRRVFGDDESSFLILAGAAALAKFILIGRLTRWDALAALMYVGTFLILHDMVQFRIALALAFVLGALLLMQQRKWVWAAAAYAPALFIHSQTAAFIMVPAVYLAFNNRYYWALGAAAGALVLAALGISADLQQFLPFLDDDRFFRNLDSSEVGGVGVTSLMIFALTAAVTPLMKFANTTQKVAYYSVISGFFALWLTIMASGVSSRLAHMFWVPLCLLAPLARHRKYSKYIWIGGAVAYFILSAFINQLLWDVRIY